MKSALSLLENGTRSGFSQPSLLLSYASSESSFPVLTRICIVLECLDKTDSVASLLHLFPLEFQPKIGIFGSTFIIAMTVYFFLILQVLLSSGTHIVAKAVSADVEPISLTFLRGLISMVAFAAIILLRRRRHIDRQDYGRFFLLAVIAVPINQFLFLYGIHYTTAGNAALLYATTPAFVFLISRYVLKEFLSTRVVVGIFLAFFGAVVVIFERGLSLSSSYTYGNLMIFLAVISWAIYTVAGKPMVIKYGAFQVSAISMIGGTILFLPIGIYGLATFDLAALTVQDWSGLFYLGWATSILSYVLWFYAVGRLATAKVAIFSNAQPIVTTLLSYLIFHQPIGASVITGGVLTIAGVAIAQQERPHPRRRAGA